MKPKIVFLVMSAVSRPETVDQLARALAPHTVLVHHDFSQTPNFPLTAPNVVFVPNPKRTGWAFFGFTDGIFHSMQYALANLDFDYLQLLSPTCLPIKPVEQFESHVSGRADAHFDCVDVFRDQDALMSVGYRALTPEKTFRHRVARRLSSAYFGASPGRRNEAGIWLRSGGTRGVAAWIALWATKALSQPLIGRHIFDEKFRPYCGSTWFGARRHLVAAMVDSFSRPGVRDYFSPLRIAEEFLIPTLLMDLGPIKGAMNHCIQLFEEAHAGVFDEQHIDQLKKSPAYFARKFPDDPLARVRVRVLDELVGAHAAFETTEAVQASAGAELNRFRFPTRQAADPVQLLWSP
jgi:Core-2/I-Branching enzyme